LNATRLVKVLRHPIAQNAAALYAAQFVLTVLPILTLPWLARALGPSELGVVVLVQSLSFLLGMLIEYGFGLSATRQVARDRDDREALAGTVAGVQGAKLSLIAVATVAAVAAFLAVPLLRADVRLLAFAWILGVLQGLNPGWFLAGLERFRTTALVDVPIRLAGAAAIILLVRDPGDGFTVLWIWTLTAALSCGILTVLVYRVVPPRRPRAPERREAMRAGWPMFISTAATSLYTIGTTVMLGVVVASAHVAFYASAERVVRASLRATGGVVGATYPRVSYLVSSGQSDRAHRLGAISLALLFGLATFTALILIVLAPWIIDVFLGPEYDGAVPILRTLALLVPLIAVGSAVTTQWLFPHGLERPATLVVVAAGFVNIATTLVIGSMVGVQGVAWALVVLEIGVTLGLVLIGWRHGLLPTRAQLLGR
jgi:PST family polysaccharide transporter